MEVNESVLTQYAELGLLHSVDIRFGFFVKIKDVSCLFTLLFIILGLK